MPSVPLHKKELETFWPVYSSGCASTVPHRTAMKKTGMVASDSSKERAVALLQESFEPQAKAEDLVLMKNRLGEEAPGVLGAGAGTDESSKWGLTGLASRSPRGVVPRRGRGRRTLCTTAVSELGHD